jgi:hypothetical protein
MCSVSMRRRVVSAVVAAVGLSLATGVIVMQAAARGSTHAAPVTHRIRPRPRPRYDPANYTTRIDNAWFPLKPGVTYVYRGRDNGKRSHDVVSVRHRIFKIVGVACRVVKDRLYLNGRLKERTKDYYTQDEDGNVWYFGEDTEELDRNGNVVSREGSWRTGRNGAEAGIFMQADPQVGDQFRQEFYRRHAEDHYQVLSLGAEVKVPYGHFGRNQLRRNVELTKEWTPLEPEVRDHKYYVRGIGEVKELTVRGGHETAGLVRIFLR